jgi:hypothetical protein
VGNTNYRSSTDTKLPTVQNQIWHSWLGWREEDLCQTWQRSIGGCVLKHRWIITVWARFCSLQTRYSPNPSSYLHVENAKRSGLTWGCAWGLRFINLFRGNFPQADKFFFVRLPAWKFSLNIFEMVRYRIKLPTEHLQEIRQAQSNDDVTSGLRHSLEAEIAYRPLPAYQKTR